MFTHDEFLMDEDTDEVTSAFMVEDEEDELEGEDEEVAKTPGIDEEEEEKL